MGRVLLFLWAIAVASGQDDLASDPQNLAMLDALQSYAESPLCLRCASSRDLTQIPGISRVTAARIRSAVDSLVDSAVSMSDLSRRACLTTDQHILISTTCTLHCTCTTWLESWIKSGRLRLRAQWREGRTPDWSSRLDLTTAAGRVGALLRATGTESVRGGWALIPLDRYMIGVGDVSLASGLGIALGGGGGFGRSPMSRLSNLSTDVRLRPYTSTWQESLKRGIAVHVSALTAELPIDVGVVWSPVSVDGTPETSLLASVRMPLWTSAVGGIHTYRDGTTTLTTADMEVQLDSWHLHSEIGVHGADRWAMLLIARREIPSGSVSAAVRWSDPDLRHPYAAAISQASILGNEAGCLVGFHYRQDRWNIEASLDVHGRPSRSYSVPMPTRGLDAITDVQIKLVRGVELDARCRYEVDDVSTSGVMTRRHRTTLRADLTAQVQRQLRLRLRSDVRRATWEHGEIHEGYLGYIEARWTFLTSSHVTARYTTYWSTSFDVAPYAMEVPVVGVFNTVVGSGIGARLLLAASWQPIPSIRCSVSTVLLQAQASATAQLDVRM